MSATVKSKSTRNATSKVRRRLLKPGAGISYTEWLEQQRALLDALKEKTP